MEDFKAILRLVDSRLSLPLVYEGCHAILRSRMPAANMFVCILEDEGLRFPYFADERLPEDPLAIYPKEGWTAYVIDLGRRYWLARDPAPPAEASPVGPLPQDWVGLPILGRDGSALGVLAVQTYQAGTGYTEEDVSFLEYTADALSVAIQLAHQDREIAIRRIATLVDETVDLHELYPKIHQIIQAIIPAARKNIIISRVDEAGGVFLPVYWHDEKDNLDDLHWPLSHGMSGYIYGVTHSSFIYEDGKTPLPTGILHIGSMPKYWLGSPLFYRDRIIGIVVIQTYDSNDVITKEDEYAINGICPSIASAISHMEFFSKLLG